MKGEIILSIGKTYLVVENGNKVKLPSGRYFCYGCNLERKFIPYPHSGTIDCCPKCGSSIVYVLE